MSLTFERVDEILKSYGMVSYTRKNGQLTEYKLEDRKINVNKKKVVTEVRPLVNGGVRGYIYVNHLKEYENIKTEDGYIPIGDMTEEELKSTIEKIIKDYR